MNFLDTLAGWAKSAWNAILGGPGDIAGAFTKIWNFVNSLGSVVSWVVSAPIRGLAKIIAFDRQVIQDLIDAFQGAQQRAPAWTWLTQIVPVRNALERAIAALRAWAATMFAATWELMWRLYWSSLAYTDQQVSAERAARIRADQAEHAAMLANVKAAIALIQRQASGGWNAGNANRVTLITRLLDDLAVRNPLVKDLVGIAVRILLDIETIDNPVARYLLGKALTEIIDKAGVDAAVGKLARALLGPLAGQPRITDLYGTAKDAAARISALEEWVAGFMSAGGPEVEQAGQEWKTITGLAADAAILGMTALAVNDPAAWARGIADTVGEAGNAAMTGIVDLIRAF